MRRLHGASERRFGEIVHDACGASRRRAGHDNRRHRHSGKLHPMQAAFRECHALQCGFCTPGMIMSAIDLVQNSPTLDEAAVRHGLEGNICRCTGYHNIVRAVLTAAPREWGVGCHERDRHRQIGQTCRRYSVHHRPRPLYRRHQSTRSGIRGVSCAPPMRARASSPSMCRRRWKSKGCSRC